MIATLLTLALAQAVTTTPPTGVLWDYPDASIAFTIFRVCVDDAPCEFKAPADVKAEKDADTAADHSTYGIALPPLLVGPHRVTVRACDADLLESLCSADVTLSFRLAVVPVAPVNPRADGRTR